MGLSYTYDDKVLEPMSSASWSWEVKGVIKNFDIKKSKAVWGANEPAQLQGDVCVMAFRVLEKAKLTQTKVTCELIVKNRGEEVGVYEAEALVGMRCEHEYGPWTTKDGSWHTAQCKLCKKVITQSHMWDDGVEKTENQNHFLRYTCTECLETKDLTLGDAFTNEVKPTQPVTETPTAPNMDIAPTTPKIEVNPTKPVTNTVPNTSTTGNVSGDSQNTNSNMNDSNNDQLNADKNQNPDHQHADELSPDDDHSHIEENQEQTVPTNDDHIIVEPTEEHTHDHTELSTNGNNPVTGIVVAAAVVILLGTAIYFVKKK